MPVKEVAHNGMHLSKLRAVDSNRGTLLYENYTLMFKN